jgi:hypothetical protein
MISQVWGNFRVVDIVFNLGSKIMKKKLLLTH